MYAFVHSNMWMYHVRVEPRSKGLQISFVQGRWTLRKKNCNQLHGLRVRKKREDRKKEKKKMLAFDVVVYLSF